MSGSRAPRARFERRLGRSLLVVEEWHPRAAERKAGRESTDVRNVLAELGNEDPEMRHAGGTDVLVLHTAILGRTAPH
jgi:hypothetical protein